MTARVLAAVGRGDPLALTVTAGGIVTIASPTGAVDVTPGDVERIEATRAPRWVWWSAPSVAAVLVAVPVARAWDIAAVHRLLHGGWRADPSIAWARSHGLDPESVPALREPDLFDLGPEPTELGLPSDPR